MTQQKILGIGNSLTDILTQIEDESLLAELQLPKGSMTHVDAATCLKIGERLSDFNNTMVAGGSAANTMSGLAQLGVETGFLGMVGEDEIGRFFENEMCKSKVKPLVLKSKTPSGRVQAMVTPDGERTFATYLGAALDLSANDIKPELFEGWDIFYVEGYLVANPKMLDKALATAKSLGMKIAIDMASYNMVEDFHDYFKHIIDNYVDIIFANEQEAKALTGMEPEDALHFLAKKCEIAVVKVGAKGSYVQRGDEVVTIGPMKSQVIDTTGAGDLWAAGFLAGLVKGYGLHKCGMMGGIVAANVIEVMGAKMDEARWEKIHEAIAKL